ncbi:MAG TPA: PQQ-like beta-propeller repeat protein [Candidatus Paceibacterota bacterium]|nr:PQQ-like beta-propeller repeat protein [Verrucomicrobiota bacterium]HSA01812.1 PQQ-like beta-propeller repeat protein [Candidatus Paceibacterota bacterium]
MVAALRQNQPLARLAALAMIGFSATIPPKAADWPGWRGPSRNGISTETRLNWTWPSTGPKALWGSSVGKGYSSLAVAAGRVYTMGNSNNVDTILCLDAGSGQVIWKHSYDCPLDPLSYEGGPSSTPAVDHHRLYTLSKSGHLFCLDTENGSVIWTRKFEAPPATPADYKVWWGFAGSPLVTSNHLVLAIGAAGLALDKQTGKTIWDNGPGRPGYSSPLPFQIGDQSGYLFLSGHELVGTDAPTGKVLWKIPWRTTWDQNAPDAIVADGKLFVATGHGVGCALFDLASGSPTQLWRNKNLRPELSTGVLWQNHIFGFDQKRLTCIDLKTGEKKWTVEDTSQGSLILADSKLIVLQETGELLVAQANPEAYQPLAKAKILEGRCWSTPTLAAGHLYARSALGDLVCLDLN